MSLSSGQTLSHYRLVEQIGQGGMGEVHLAYDTRLQRDVALKVLPEGMLSNETVRGRFRREARAISKLNHPNIATVHDFDTQNDVDFLVMEYIRGVTLNDMLNAGGLPEETVTHLGTQLAAGLAAAHDEGVIHRDIKPGNLRVTPDGRLKILDFGLAKLLQPADLSETAITMTKTQGIVGTPFYMSPEQVRDEEVDARTDIFAAGIVLYEMATGKRPFEAKSAMALGADIQHKSPTPPKQVNLSLSSRLEEIILKCLEKKPDRRYPSAKDLLADLERLKTPSSMTDVWRHLAPQRRWSLWGGAALAGLLLAMGLLNVGGLLEKLLAGDGRKSAVSIAVLPLENLSGDPEQEFFTAGVTDGLITNLGMIATVRPIARRSVMRYKGTDKRLPEIARELNVETLLVGAVTPMGQTVRITASLIDASSEQAFWSEAYQDDLRNVLALQGAVVLDVVKQMGVEITPVEQARLVNAPEVDPEAYNAVQRGAYYHDRWVEGFPKALREFRKAIEIDPLYSPAWAGMATTYKNQFIFGVLSYEAAAPKARAAAEKAVEFDDSLAEAHYALAATKEVFDWDWNGAGDEYERALGLNPSLPAKGYALHLVNMGRFEEGIDLGRRAVEDDPLSFSTSTHMSLLYSLAGHPDESMQQAKETLELDPDNALRLWPHALMAMNYTKKEMYVEACAEADKSLAAVADLPSGRWVQYPFGVLGWVYGASGRPAKAMEILDQLKSTNEGWIDSGYVAMIHAGLGEVDSAFEALDEAYEERSWALTVLSVHPAFDPLRADPRFKDLLRRMNFPE